MSKPGWIRRKCPRCKKMRPVIYFGELCLMCIKQLHRHARSPQNTDKALKEPLIVRYAERAALGLPLFD